MNQPQKKSGIFQWIDVNDWPKYEAEGWTVVSRMTSFMSYDSLGIVKEDKNLEKKFNEVSLNAQNSLQDCRSSILTALDDKLP